jgi:hypothetical protein
MTVRQRTLGAGTSAFATMFPQLLTLVVESTLDVVAIIPRIPATTESKGSEIWRFPPGRAVGSAEAPPLTRSKCRGHRFRDAFGVKI